MVLKNIDIQKRGRHVTFCGIADYAVKGSQAERETVQYLLDHLHMEVVGDYRLLVNYNITDQNSGNSLEVDVVVINRLGIFLLEVKNWRGLIEADDDAWILRTRKGEQTRKNAWKSIAYKARVLYSQLFEKNGDFPVLNNASVTGIVVLTQGIQYYINHGHDDGRRILDLSNPLTEGLSTTRLLHRGPRSRLLSDSEILAISQALYRKHQPREVIVHNYRIVRDLAYGVLYETFEAQHTQIETRRVRLKRYQLHSFTEEVMKHDILLFQRSVKAVSALGSHPNILATQDFFADDIRQQEDVFYEITELPTGPGLEDVMQMIAQQGRKMPLNQQLSYLEPVCQALYHAHYHKNQRGRSAPIYHRNICPEAVFQMQDGTVKLGDFDFSKYGDDTLTVPDEALVEGPYIAPEVLQNPSLATANSDIYAVGVLWYFLSCLPARPRNFDFAHIDDLNLPEKARALLKRMTAKKIAERPEDIQEVQSELSQIKEEAK